MLSIHRTAPLTCPECGAEVDILIETCDNCGFPFKAEEKTRKKWKREHQERDRNEERQKRQIAFSRWMMIAYGLITILLPYWLQTEERYVSRDCRTFETMVGIFYLLFALLSFAVPHISLLAIALIFFTGHVVYGFVENDLMPEVLVIKLVFTAPALIGVISAWRLRSLNMKKEAEKSIF